MLKKSALFAGVMIVAVPALAQQAETPKPTAPTVAPGAASVPEVPDENEDATAQTKRAARPADADQSAAVGDDHVSTIVHAEFAAYDKDGNGTLEKAEFTAWMDALKARAPEETKPSSETWNNAAFAQADKDESASLTRAELTGFLRG